MAIMKNRDVQFVKGKQQYDRIKAHKKKIELNNSSQKEIKKNKKN